MSSDNLKILKLAKKYGAQTIVILKSLSNDNYYIDAWKHAVIYLKK